MQWLVILISLLLHGSVCRASVFGYKGDLLKGSQTACTHQNIASGLGIAHRTLPCGTRVAILNPRTMKMTVATVIDHGPYGAIDDGEWVIKRTKTDPGQWRGCLDLTKTTAAAIGHNGFEKVLYYILPENLRYSLLGGLK